MKRWSSFKNVKFGSIQYILIIMICVVISMIICACRQKKYEHLDVFGFTDNTNTDNTDTDNKLFGGLPDIPEGVLSLLPILVCNNDLVDLKNLNVWFTAHEYQMFIVIIRDLSKLNAIVDDFTSKYGTDPIGVTLYNGFTAILTLTQLEYLLTQPGVHYIECDTEVRVDPQPPVDDVNIPDIPEGDPSLLPILVCNNDLVDLKNLNRWFTALKSKMFIVKIRYLSQLDDIVKHFRDEWGGDPIDDFGEMLDDGFRANLGLRQLSYLLAQPGVQSIECDNEVSVYPQPPVADPPYWDDPYQFYPITTLYQN